MISRVSVAILANVLVSIVGTSAEGEKESKNDEKILIIGSYQSSDGPVVSDHQVDRMCRQVNKMKHIDQSDEKIKEFLTGEITNVLSARLDDKMKGLVWLANFFRSF